MNTSTTNTSTTNTLPRRRLLLLPALCAAACSGGGGGGAPTTTPTAEGVVAAGTLTLGGADAARFGGELEIGDAARVNGPGTVRTYYCLDAGSRVAGFEYDVSQTPSSVFANTTLADPRNAFVLNAIDDVLASGTNGISMTIVVQGEEFDYTCTFCDGLTFDDGAQTIGFDDVEVQAAGGAATGPLTLDGTIVWGLPE